jgi:hypothetical protein
MAKPADPFAQRRPAMPGSWGFPSIHFTIPSSTSTRMGHLTLHMPQILKTDFFILLTSCFKKRPMISESHLKIGGNAAKKNRHYTGY